MSEHVCSYLLYLWECNHRHSWGVEGSVSAHRRVCVIILVMPLISVCTHLLRLCSCLCDRQKCFKLLPQRHYNQTNTQSPHRAEGPAAHTYTHTHTHDRTHLLLLLAHTGTPKIVHSSKQLPAAYNCTSCVLIPQNSRHPQPLCCLPCW